MFDFYGDHSIQSGAIRLICWKSPSKANTLLDSIARRAAAAAPS